MHPSIAQRFEHLELRRHSLVEKVRSLPPAKQSTKPDPKSFSPVDLVMHLALAEQMSVLRMTKVGPKDLIGKNPKTTFIFRKIVANMRQGKKMPAPSQTIPEGRLSIESASDFWTETRKNLFTFFCETKRAEDPMQQFFLFGTMSAADLVELFEAHMDYHDKWFPHN